MVRTATCKALEMADEGLISYRTLAECALKWMSEDEVVAMLTANEIYLTDEDENCENDSTALSADCDIEEEANNA